MHMASKHPNPEDTMWKKKSRQERLELFVLLKRKLRSLPVRPGTINVYYMFYDRDNPRVVQDEQFNKVFVYDKDDIERI